MAVIGVFLLHVIRKSGFKLSYVIIPAGVVAAGCALTLFQMKYYGDPVPNTYYLKVAGVTAFERASRGIRVLLELFVYHLWPLLLLAAIGFWKSVSLRKNPKLILLLGMFLCQCAYSVYVGGDAWEWMHFSNRYIAIAVPGLFVLVSAFLCDPETVKIKTASVFLPALGVGLLAEGVFYFREDTRELPAVGAGLAELFIVVGGAWMAFSLLYRRRPMSSVFAAIIAVMVGVALNFFGVTNWIQGTNNGGLLEADADAVRAGLALRQVTTPAARIAYIAAGAMPYFAGRKAIDLLGKSDPVIAKGKPAAPFYPGHSKWNYAYSIGQLKPDIVTILWSPTRADKKNMAEWGYAISHYGYYLKDSTNINRALIEASAP